MSYSKEILYHLYCEKCHFWFTISDKINETLYCPKCREIMSTKIKYNQINNDENKS